jgi:hypothetical protein
MRRDKPQISFIKSRLNAVRPFCVFFANKKVAYRLLLPLVQHGFGCGDQAVHGVKPAYTPSGCDA